MKKIKTTDIIVGSAMPLKSGSLDHLQSAYQEPLIDIIQTFEARNDVESYPVYTTPVIMYGCRWNGLGVSEGVLAYGTEIFRCPSQLITLGFGQVVIGTITTTYFTATNADPVVFSDATSNNVHEIRQIVWSAGTSGAGDFDFDDCLMWGRWIDVPFNSSYISASTGVLSLPGGSLDWQVRWKQVGRTIAIDFNIEFMSLDAPGTDATYLTLSMPFNADFKKDHHSVCFYKHSTASPAQGICIARAIEATTDIRFILPTGLWLIGSIISVAGQITCELDKA
jgi:hypothetical protein